MTEQIAVTREDLPAQYRAADDAATSAQRVYKALLGTSLSLIASAALLASLSPGSGAAQSWLQGGSALCFLISFVLTIWLAKQAPERQWYGCRSVAETTLSLAWKYMCGADPFLSPGRGEDPTKADNEFAKRLEELRATRNDVASTFAAATATGEQITDAMRRMRGKTAIERRDAYLRCRIVDQLDWYSNKAELWRKRETQFFALSLFAQSAAVVLAVSDILADSWSWHSSGFAAAVASSIIAWVQMGKYGELAQSYAYAAGELQTARVMAKNARSEKDLARVVSDSETAISREHTGWAARRGDTLPFR